LVTLTQSLQATRQLQSHSVHYVGIRTATCSQRRMLLHLGWSQLGRRLEVFNWPRAYLIIALVLGVALVVLTPPFQTFDEPAHFYRGWTLAEGHILPERQSYPMLPASVSTLEGSFPIVPMIQGTFHFSLWSAIKQLKVPFSKQQAPTLSYSMTYGPVGYVPQATAVLLLRPFGRSPVGTVYLGRLLNLICGVLLTYFALRLIPFAKVALFVIALLPMTVMLMASLSPDSLALGGIFFFSALVLRLTRQEEISNRALAALGVSGILLLNVKPAYALIALLVLLLRPAQFGSVKRYALAVTGIVGASLGLMAFLALTAPHSQALQDTILGPNNGVSSGEQVSFMLHHPVAFVKAIFATFDTRGLFYGKIAVGAFEWGNAAVTDVVAVIAGLAFAAVIAAREKVQLEAWRRALILGVSGLTALVICAAFYMSFSRVGSATVEGLQGRYFVPSVTLAFFGLAGFPFGKRWLMPLIVLVIVGILAVTTIRSILLLYY
jgi:uncharacterized membrane protein